MSHAPDRHSRSAERWENEGGAAYSASAFSEPPRELKRLAGGQRDELAQLGKILSASIPSDVKAKELAHLSPDSSHA